MKRIYTLLFACSLNALAFAQVEIYETGQSTDVSGTTVVKIRDSASTVYFPFMVKNVSGSALELDVTRMRIGYPASWEDWLTWQSPDNWSGGGYAAVQMPTNPWTTPIAVQLENNMLSTLDAIIFPDVPGTGTYRYYIVAAGDNKIDSVDVQLIYSELSVGEPEIVKGMTAYPNPSGDVLTVSATGVEDYRIRMTDVLGKVVYDETASAPKRSIDVSDFKNGVYLLTVLEKGAVIQTRRIVVKH